jgi:hypothetical protein
MTVLSMTWQCYQSRDNAVNHVTGLLIVWQCCKYVVIQVWLITHRCTICQMIKSTVMWLIAVIQLPALSHQQWHCHMINRTVTLKMALSHGWHHCHINDGSVMWSTGLSNHIIQQNCHINKGTVAWSRALLNHINSSPSLLHQPRH